MEKESTSFKEANPIQTFISEAFWWNQVGDHSHFEPAVRFVAPQGNDDGPGSWKAMCWLDILLSGGIHIPASHAESGTPHALTLLLKGPPGTGKTTLAMEFCYRWAANYKDFHACYVTTEGYAPWLKDNAIQHWKDIQKFFENGRIEVRESDVAASTSEKLIEIYREVGFHRGAAKWRSSLSALSKDKKQKSWDVVVIDSLNAAPTNEERGKLFSSLMNIVGGGPRLIIFVLDSVTPSNVGEAEFWEYVCDVVIRMDTTHPAVPSGDYMLRTIEIVKARYQEHVRGPQQLKIYPPMARQVVDSRSHGPIRLTTSADTYENTRGNSLQRVVDHPFRTEGGIVIYPSIHYLLSIFRPHNSMRTTRMVPTLDTLATLVKEGFPEGRCTALLGAQGSHKTRFALSHLLHRVLEHDESGLVISLRDDAGPLISMMTSIINARAQSSRSDHARKADWIEKFDRLSVASANGTGSPVLEDELLFWQMVSPSKFEVMCIPPGYSSTEEVLHRILMSILRLARAQRQRGKEPRITLVFNRVDQLWSQLPLCFREQLFIPALIQICAANDVTSLFVGASRIENGRSEHVLNSIADFVLIFQRPELPKAMVGPGATSSVVVEVAREAGGRPGGASVHLMLPREEVQGKVIVQELVCLAAP